MAASGYDKTVKIFDKRKSKIAQTFDDIHDGNIFDLLKIISDFYLLFIGRIYCVRWSPSGNMLANASDDRTVAVLDLTGKKLYTGETSDGSNWLLFI